LTASTAAALLLAACSDAPRPSDPRLTTLFDVQALYAAGKDATYALAPDTGVPGGQPIGRVADNGGTLTVTIDWAEGYDAEVVTTDVWAHFPEVWIQPAYVPATGWKDGAPLGVTTPWRPVFSVGPGSAFYSPYWQVVFFVRPADVAPETVTSEKQILDAGYPLHPVTQGRVMALAPQSANVPPQIMFGVRATPIGGGTQRTGWLGGGQVSFLDFPAAPFSWNSDRVVAEVPIYQFVFRRDDGSLVSVPELPRVLGTGPPYSNTPPPSTDPATITHYVPYWRVYTVELPSTAGVYAPPGTDLASKLADAGIPNNATYMAPPNDDPNILGRVTLDPSCFATDPDPGDAFCTYLDSQSRIEMYVPRAAIHATEMTLNCPVVSAKGNPAVP
jgi:hypothetical protein